MNGRRGILKALAGGAVALFAGKSFASPRPAPVGLARVKCCGTCRHLEECGSLTLGDSSLSVSVFGRCGLTKKMDTDPITHTVNGDTITIRDVSSLNANRHFLMVCAKWRKGGSKGGQGQ